MLEYHAAFFPIEDGWYLVRLLDFPEVFTQGKDLEDARFMIRDCLKLYAEMYMEDGKPLPRPNPRAKNRKAELIEPVCLSARVLRPKVHEKKKVAKVRSAV